MEARGIEDRLLSLVGSDSSEVAASKLRSLRRLILLTMSIESVLALGYLPYSEQPALYGFAAILLLGCALVGWGDRWAERSVAAAFLVELAVVVSVFPENANHQFLTLLLLGLLWIARPTRENCGEETIAAAQAMRWVVSIGFAWAGVMKLVYGAWLGGEFLSFRVATDPAFAWVFGPIIPDAELTRLVGLENVIGAGPFRADAPLLLIASNLTWMAEILLPVGLLVPQTRWASMVASILLLIVIELGAQEFFFGGLMVGLLLLFAERNRIAVALPILVCGYVGWVLYSFGGGGGA